MVYKNGILSYLIMTAAFGLPMGLLSALFTGLGVGLILGMIAGVMFSGGMFIASRVLESKYTKDRTQIAQNRAIICDGPATASGNGGWMYFTQYGLEFYPHALNLSTNEIYIPVEVIQSVNVNLNRITVSTTDMKSFTFVVSKGKKWKEQIDNYVNQMRMGQNNYQYYQY